MPWYDVLPEWLNPWAHKPSDPAAQPSPPPATAAPAPAPAPSADPGMGTLAPEEPAKKKNDLVYLGLNDPSREAEIKALPEGAAVVDGSKKQGTIMAADGKTELNLTKEEDVKRFLEESGVAARRKLDGDKGEESDEQVKARMAELEEVFLGKMGKDGKRIPGGGMAVGVRDEMAEYVQTMQKVENGEMDMKRLIISGHHYSDEMGIHGPAGQMSFADLGRVMNQFSHARDGVEDLMFSACNTANGYQQQADVYKKIFPHLQSGWGYNGIAPAPGDDQKNSSPAHIGAWSQASANHDPAEIAAEAKNRFRAKTYTYDQ